MFPCAHAYYSRYASTSTYAHTSYVPHTYRTYQLPTVHTSCLPYTYRAYQLPTVYLPYTPQWKHSHDERTRRATSSWTSDGARERVQNRDDAEAEAEAEAAAAGSAELGAPPSFAGARELV